MKPAPIFSLLKELSLTGENRFHLLRHFDSVPDDFIFELANELDTQPDVIRKQLYSSGSKFFPSFAAQPDLLWERIKTDITDTAVRTRITPRSESDTLFSLYYSPKAYPDGIGTDAVVALETFNSTDRKKVTMQVRSATDALEVPTVCLSELPTTWDVHILLRKTEHALILLTIFPGTYAPPLPAPLLQNRRELEISQKFWETHALANKMV